MQLITNTLAPASVASRLLGVEDKPAVAGGFNFMKDYSYLIGKQHGDRLIIGVSKKRHHVICQCKCGAINEVSAVIINQGRAKACRRCEADRRRGSLIGKRFGRLVVIEERWMADTGHKNDRLTCECDCGNIVEVDRNCTTVSCGCSRIKYPDRVTYKGCYSSYHAMMTRCYNPKTDNYSHYGGAGVFVFDGWHNFENFYKDLKDTWFKGATIDRFPICNGNYVPGNVRWATKAQQSQNKTNIILKEQDILDIRGSKLKQSELVKMYGVKSATISRIINNLRWKNI